MGCLRNLIKLVILILAVIGFISIGGREYLDAHVMPAVKSFNTEFQNQIQNTGKKWNDLSFNELRDLFFKSVKETKSTKKTKNGMEVTSIKGVMGYNAEVAQDSKTGQRMVTVDTKGKINLDLNKDDRAELKADIIRIAKKNKALPVSAESIDITDVGEWNVRNEKLKYAQLSLKDKKSGKDLTAIVSTLGEGKNSKLIVTFAPKEKFSKALAEKYFKE